MKCRDLQCRQEAMPDDPRCGFHKEVFDERTAAASTDLKKSTTTPTPSRKP